MNHQGKRFIKQFIIIGLFLMMQGYLSPQIPKLSKIKEKIPGLDKILQQEPAINTSLSDAVTDIPFLDDYNPQQTSPMTLLPRSSYGGFLLEFPGLFEFEAESYCLQAGKYGPGGGEGYIYAPLKGSQADIVRSILRNSVKHPEIPQRNIQVLLWAIISRAKIKDMSREIQIAAAELLTPKEIKRLEGSALGITPQELMSKAVGKLPAPVRQTLEAEAKLRQTLTQLSAPYEEIEQAAVLVGHPLPGPGSRNVPAGRWSYHPAGYFVRYFSSDYSQTTIQLNVPGRVNIERDERGRITLIEDGNGNRIETKYNDKIDALIISGDSSVRGYAFESIRLVRHKMVFPELAVKMETQWDNTGGTLVGIPSGKGHIKTSQNPFPDLERHYEFAQLHKQQLDSLSEKINLGGGIEDIIDLGHFTFAVKEVINSRAPMTQESWIKNHMDLAIRAWLSTFSASAGSIYPEPSTLEDFKGPKTGGDIDSGSVPEYDPSEGAALPGNTDRQRLGQSGRSNNKSKETCDRVKRELEEAQRIKNAYEDPELLRKAAQNDWDVNKYENEVVKKVFGDSAKIDKSHKVPMYTDPTNCKIVKNWSVERYRKEGIPDVIYEADLAHENVHHTNCSRARNPLEYNADMSFPHKRSKEESEAYGAKINKLKDWLNKNCK
jgi:hypothetical protein